MLNASEVNAVVKSVVGNGIHLALLLDPSGNAISSAFDGIPDEREAPYASMIAVTANMWRAYARCDLAVNKLNLELEQDSLEQVLIEFDDKRMCAMSVADTAVVSLVSLDPNVTVGFLKLKTAALQRQLDSMLRPVQLT